MMEGRLTALLASRPSWATCPHSLRRGAEALLEGDIEVHEASREEVVEMLGESDVVEADSNPLESLELPEPVMAASNDKSGI
jgi:hypothetical protein